MAISSAVSATTNAITANVMEVRNVSIRVFSQSTVSAISELLTVLCRARKFPQRRSHGPAEYDRERERDQGLGDRRDVEVEQSVLQPECDRIVHEKHAICVSLHRIEHAPAQSFEAQEERQDRKQD